MIRFVLLLLIGISVSGRALCQVDTVAVFLQKIKSASDDSVKLIYADQISACLEKIGYGSYALTAPVKFMGYKKCVNEEAELFSWTIPIENGQMFYNWFRFKEEAKPYLLKSVSRPDSESSAWLYYDMIAFDSGGERYFAILGWNRTRNTNQKIVRIARFEENGVITFDHPLMRRGESRSASLSFEYAPDGSMMLKQDKKGKRILFDHLAPNDKKYEGYFMFYGPDASYDALVLKGGEWWFQENVKMK